MHPQQGLPGQSGPPDQLDQAAIVLAVAAAFLWANPLYELTETAFRDIAIRNYGYEPLHILQLGYRIALHAGIFVLARVAIRWALVALVTAIGYRLAFSL